ncbi:uncharacterized protein MYCFIDRAFT_137398, partial [Pseudocercospora fijiensis CIRAD86]
HYINATNIALLYIATIIEEDVIGERLLGFAGPFNFNDIVNVLEKLDTIGTKR